MDIRTKLILALVSVSLLSMVILGIFAYKTSAMLFKETSVRQLEALAESKKANLKNLYSNWKTQIRLIGSDSRLGKGFSAYMANPSEALREALLHVLNDSLSASEEIQGLYLFDAVGKSQLSVGKVATLGREVLPQTLLEQIQEGGVPEKKVYYSGSHSTGEDKVQINFFYPLYAPDAAVQDVFQGWIAVVIKPSDLFSVTDNFTGLGKTGEILLVIANETGHAVILNSVRHSINEGYWQLEGTEQSADVKAAIAGQDAHFTAHVRDYRGEAVWSVVRYVEGLEWGLIVKVDVAEEREYVGVLRDAMTDLAMALSAFAIVGGTLLGIYLARPIQHLASVVHKLRDGHLNVTAEVRGDDEVAYMAQSLNHLIEDLRAEAKASGKDSSDA